MSARVFGKADVRVPEMNSSEVQPEALAKQRFLNEVMVVHDGDVLQAAVEHPVKREGAGRVLWVLFQAVLPLPLSSTGELCL